MPPKNTFTEEMLLGAAFKIVRHQGIKKLSARSLAKELNCSTTPIYRYLDSMDKVEKIMRKRAINLLLEYQLTRRTGHAFFDMGLGYILFAKNEKNLFRLLYMSGYAQQNKPGPEKSGRDSVLYTSGMVVTDDSPEKIDIKSGRILQKEIVAALIPQMKTDPKVAGLDDQLLENVLSKMWVFVHGIAMLINSEAVVLDNEESLIQMLHEMGWFVADGERQKQAGKYKDIWPVDELN